MVHSLNNTAFPQMNRNHLRIYDRELGQWENGGGRVLDIGSGQERQRDASQCLKLRNHVPVHTPMCIHVSKSPHYAPWPSTGMIYMYRRAEGTEKQAHYILWVRHKHTHYHSQAQNITKQFIFISQSHIS